MQRESLRGLTSAEVAEHVATGRANDVPSAPTRTVTQIVRANLFTRFNALLGAMLVVILLVGQFRDALFGFALIANTLIGIVQELRAKRTLDRLSVLTAPKAAVLRDDTEREVAVSQVVLDDALHLGPGGRGAGITLGQQRTAATMVLTWIGPLVLSIIAAPPTRARLLVWSMAG